MIKCVVSGCPNCITGKGRPNWPQKRFFSFPKDQARVKVWLAALRETERQDSSEQHLICEDHFLPQHISPGGGIREDAIPIMPPYLDGPLGLVSPWGEESSEDDGQWADDAEEDPPVHEEDPPVREEDPPKQVKSLNKPQETVEQRTTSYRRHMPKEVHSKHEVSLALVTRRLLEQMVSAPDGVLDLRHAVATLRTRRRRVCDITNVLSSICLIKKESANRFKWIADMPVSCFLKRRQHSIQKELSNLKTVEDSLDELIRTCARQLFELTDNVDNMKSAYITYEDVSRVKVFQDQTILAIKAPEDTKLEVPTPREDSIQMNVKALRGPIAVVTSEMGPPAGVATSAAGGNTGGFLTLEGSRVRTAPLRTESTSTQTTTPSL